MQEYFTEAVVLDCEPSGDLDSRVSLFTKRFGKFIVKAKSARKITSKLSPHLGPGNVVEARLVEKNGLQIADALKQSKLEMTPADLYALNLLLPENEPEPHLWQLLVSRRWKWAAALKILGWDPEETLCSICGKKTPRAFKISSQEFVCGECSSKFERAELLYIY